ncbi:MAG TPA: nitroreductase family protein [Syntrophorhabdales bacterium]|nr:nitroreductase family protein [Syntrophorhabdales bacterium]
MSLVTIDPERCKKDGLCVRICQKVFSQDAEGSIPVVAHAASCNSCGHCVLVCPSGAIRQIDCPPEMVHPVRPDLMPSYEQVQEMIVARRSIRTFQERPVEKEIIEKVIDGARFAPSLKNTQSTRFTVVQDKTLLHAIASSTAQWLGKVANRLKNPLWRKLYTLRGERDVKQVLRWIEQLDLMAEKMSQNIDLVLFGAPLLVLFHADETMRSADVNATLALHNAMMLASSLGLGSFYTGYVVTACSHDRAVPRLLDLPRKQKVYGGLALGYPAIQFSRWIDRRPAQIRWL